MKIKILVQNLKSQIIQNFVDFEMFINTFLTFLQQPQLDFCIQRFKGYLYFPTFNNTIS